MNAQLIQRDQPMSVGERAAAALNREEAEAEIKSLVAETKSIVAVIDPASRAVCHKSMMDLKNLRLMIENRAKEGRAEAVAYSKAVIAIEKELVAMITPDETRLLAIRDEWDTAKEREREAAVQAELARVATIRERIEYLRGCQILTPTSGSSLILEHIGDLEGEPVDETFDEFRQQAYDAKAGGLARLRAIHAAALAHEAEQASIVAEREELAKLRAEAAERDRIAAEERAKIEATEKAARDAEAARIAQENRQERERIAEDNRVAKAQRDADAAKAAEVARLERVENERIASERRAELDRQEAEAKAVRDAEAQRLADERKVFEAQQEAARVAALPKKPKGKLKVPTEADILNALSAHYGASELTVRGWLSLYAWSK